jgi:thiamine-phosphate pyrophosphorylase
MQSRHACPPLWHLTDGRRLAISAALMRLPQGSGLVLREYKAQQRSKLLAAHALSARRKRLVTLVAQDTKLTKRLMARKLASGAHLPGRVLGKALPFYRTFALRSAVAHSLPQGIKALRAGANILFISPVCPTRSHPGAPHLGALRARLLASRLQSRGASVIALGGIASRHLNSLEGFPRLSGIAAVEWIGTSPPSLLARTMARRGTKQKKKIPILSGQ